VAGAIELVTLAEVHSAAGRLEAVVAQTPLERSRAIGARVGADVWLKCENLQRAGSFKIRGAYNRISRLSPEERKRGVVCASAGNHAQGVALAASLQGVSARIIMPEEAPLPKIDATVGYGAEVELEGHSFDDAMAAAFALADRDGRVFVHPFDHRDIVAGQGTVGLELIEQLPGLATVVVCVGGGGLISGMAVALKALRPDVRIVGVQAAGCSTFQPSLAAGEPVAAAHADTIADGIAVKRPGELTLAHVQALVDDWVTVSDEEIADAVVLLLERAKLVVEPSGAAAVAALMAGHVGGVDDRPLRGPVVATVSGGNIDPLLLQHLVTGGLASQGRYATLRTRVSDRPGGLTGLLRIVAMQRANVVGVTHRRLESRLRLGEVVVVLELETRGPEHVAELTSALEQAGYPVQPS
jgi:threonine dehydratase